MVADSEQPLHEMAQLNPKEIVTRIPNDPRLPSVDKWLRGFSIDEIPQIGERAARPYVAGRLASGDINSGSPAV